MIEVAERFTPRLEREMAGEAQAEIFGNFTFPDGEVPHPSVILNTRSKPEHKLGELYDDVETKDDELFGRVLKSEDAVTSLPMRWEPQAETANAVAAADLCEKYISEAPWRDTATRHHLRGEFRGIAISEMTWRSEEGFAVPAIADRPMWRFGFKRSRPHVLHVRRHAKSAFGRLIPVPPSKFITTRCGSCDGPWGSGLYDKIYWRSYITTHTWQWWSEGIERWVSPTTLVKYSNKPERGTDASNQEKAFALAQAIRGGNSIAMPEDLEAELLEAVQGGMAQFSQFIDKCNRAKSMLILGEVNTSGDRPGVGAFASDTISNDIRLEKVRGRVRIAMFALKQVAASMTAFNFGPDVPVPIPVMELEDATSLETRREGIQGALGLGLAVPARQARAAFQVDRPRAGEEVITAADVAQAMARSQAA